MTPQNWTTTIVQVAKTRTSVRLLNDFIYLAVIMDVFARGIRGWHLGRGLDHTLLRGSVQGKAVKDQQLLERITLDPTVMVGKPIIKGTRLTVEYILNLLAHGATVTEILDEYEGLTHKDIQACLLFATKSLADTLFMPLAVEAA